MTYKPDKLGQSDLVFDHARRGMVYNFSRVCLSDDNFRKT